LAALFASTKDYSDNKKCWAPKGAEPALSEIPQLTDLYGEAEQRFSRLDAFLNSLEGQLSECLRSDTLPTAQLVEAIAVGKVRAVEDTIELCFRLKQDVGSFALMGGTGFEQMDFLQCTKFAEGDSRILMQKITRDRLKAHKKNKKGGSAEEEARCKELEEALAEGGPTAWNDNWRRVYALAEVVMERIMCSYVPEVPVPQDPYVPKANAALLPYGKSKL